jgi:hypothetical protein
MNPFAFEMGGRNQKTQLLRSWWLGADADTTDEDPAAVLLESANESFDAGLPVTLLPKTPSRADFSAEGVLAAEPSEASKGFPGDLGVFADVLPNEAKAPEPRPKALEAPPVGDASAAPGVVMELKGLDFPCEELSPPNRLENGALRPEGLSPWPDVLRVRLLVLRVRTD